MSRKIYFILLILIGFTSCAVKKTPNQIEAEKRAIIEKIKTLDFRFNATSVYPMGHFPPRQLTTAYDVTINSDTLISHLPYFGVAYSAPWDSRESPLIFKSMNFKYEINKGDKLANWIIRIYILDKRHPLTFYFSIWENGNADLMVWDSNSQAISFRGNIE